MKNNDNLHSYSCSATATYNEDFYLKAAKDFIRSATGNILSSHLQDPMAHYLYTTTQSPDIIRWALANKLGNRVYIDTVMLFVSQYLQKTNFYVQRSKFENEQIDEARHWSEEKIETEWKGIVDEMQLKYGNQGFCGTFYEKEWNSSSIEKHPPLWFNLLEEWKHYVELNIYLQKTHYIQSHQTQLNQSLLNNLVSTQKYVQEKNLSDEDVLQTLSLMGGRWTSFEFERLLAIARLQYKYPILNQIARKIGRTADSDGTHHIPTVSGMNASMKSAAHNDITGIGIGKDFESLLPTEWAIFSDPTLQDVFFKKYVTGRLQTFDHKSQSLQAARSLRTQSAALKGPIVVCLDTSGSMMGEPTKIALSLMMRLTEISEQQDRECYLITFSVHACPIDVRRDRAKLVQYFTQQASGNTDATRMIDQTEKLLTEKHRYVGADILWITDFRIPIPPPLYLQRLTLFRESGTHLYGLQLGIAENHWTPYFDKIYHLEDIKMSIF